MKSCVAGKPRHLPNEDMTDWKDIRRKMLAKGGYLLRRASVVERNGQLARESLALARQSCPSSIASVYSLYAFS